MHEPSVEELSAFLLGTLSAPAAERMAAWVDEAHHAVAALRAAPAHDALTRDVVAAQTLPPPDGAVERVLQGVLPTTTLERTHLGGYRLVRELGRGGMGVVYEAVDERLNRRAAVKVLGPNVSGDPVYRERFLREARAVASLKSDHIVTVFRADEDDGVLFLAMEYLEGTTLSDWLAAREQAVSADEVRWVARDVLSGLAIAHAFGVIHRDIKPSNLWVERDTGRVKILDFGLAAGPETGPPLTRQGQVFGTPEYMAPEQIEGQLLSPRCDLFSLGVVLYQLVTRRSPFRRETPLATLAAVGNVPLPPLQGVPSELADFIAHLTDKQPTQRPADASAALKVLPGVAFRSAKGRPVAPRLAALAVLLLVGALALWLGVFRVKTAEGTLVVEVSEPDAVVYVDGTRVTVAWNKQRTTAEIRVGPGKHQLELRKAGFVVFGQEVELRDGKRSILKAALEPVQPPPPAATVVRVMITADTHGFDDLKGTTFRDNPTLKRGWKGDRLAVDEDRNLWRIRLDKYPKEPVWIKPGALELEPK